MMSFSYVGNPYRSQSPPSRWLHAAPRRFECAKLNHMLERSVPRILVKWLVM